MLNLIKKTELDYSKEFATFKENDEVIRFTDSRLPDMNHHNFTYIKENLSEERIAKVVTSEIQRRLDTKSEFLLLISDFKIDENLFKDLPYKVTFESYDYMNFDTSIVDRLKNRDDFTVKEAASEDILKDGIKVDITCNTPYMGDFAIKRIQRKSEVYRDQNLKTKLYVGYHNDTCIGNCELFNNNDIAKLEDFDIAEEFQRKGFGTSFLKYLISIVREENIDTAYVVTESTDTAKNMYTKCHFKKAGQKHEVFIDFNAL